MCCHSVADVDSSSEAWLRVYRIESNYLSGIFNCLPLLHLKCHRTSDVFYSLEQSRDFPFKISWGLNTVECHGSKWKLLCRCYAGMLSMSWITHRSSNNVHQVADNNRYTMSIRPMDCVRAGCNQRFRGICCLNWKWPQNVLADNVW